jgi:hypothetical protein
VSAVSLFQFCLDMKSCLLLQSLSLDDLIKIKINMFTESKGRITLLLHMEGHYNMIYIHTYIHTYIHIHTSHTIQSKNGISVYSAPQWCSELDSNPYIQHLWDLQKIYINIILTIWDQANNILPLFCSPSCWMPWRSGRASLRTLLEKCHTSPSWYYLI